MNKLLIILKKLAFMIVNLIVFGTSGWIAVIMSNVLISTYPDLNNIYRVLWMIGICVLWINTSRIDWISWIFKTKDESEHKKE